MADHDGNGGNGNVIDRPRDEGGPMEVETRGEQAAGAIASLGARVSKGGDGDQGREQAV